MCVLGAAGKLPDSQAAARGGGGAGPAAHLLPVRWGGRGGGGLGRDCPAGDPGTQSQTGAANSHWMIYIFLLCCRSTGCSTAGGPCPPCLSSGNAVATQQLL